MTTDEVSSGRAVLDVARYAGARLALVAVVSAVIFWIARIIGLSDLPLIVAVMLAMIIALPLGMWVFTPLRRRANASLAGIGARRRRERAQLQARLRGESG